MRSHGLAGGRLAALVAAAALAAGCAVDNAREQAIYRESLDEKLPAAAWPGPGEVLTMVDAMRLANRQNEPLAISGENYLQSLISRDRAISVLLPSISLVPMRTEMESFAAPGPVGAIFPIRTTDVPIQIGLNLSVS